MKNFEKAYELLTTFKKVMTEEIISNADERNTIGGHQRLAIQFIDDMIEKARWDEEACKDILNWLKKCSTLALFDALKHIGFKRFENNMADNACYQLDSTSLRFNKYLRSNK